jgi:hypothetical protein
MYTIDTPLAISNPASEAQLSYIRDLVNRKYAEADRGQYLDFLDTAQISKVRASEIITHLKTLPNAEGSSEVGANDDVEVGLYLVDGVAYKVKRAVYGSGFLYACRWDEESASFVKESGAIRKIHANHRMTLEQASPYGLAMSACAHCGRPLTDEESIARGLGPICAEKYS